MTTWTVLSVNTTQSGAAAGVTEAIAVHGLKDVVPLAQSASVDEVMKSVPPATAATYRV